jgi:hypothetical protein
MAALPLVVLAVLLLIDVWVYFDAAARAEQGNPVVFSLGSFRVQQPAVWFGLCLILSVVFIPIYVAIRTP